ncbi:MAG: hypothetical protein R2712_05330 [Vicinamibacterales bacterium]
MLHRDHRVVHVAGARSMSAMAVLERASVLSTFSSIPMSESVKLPPDSPPAAPIFEAAAPPRARADVEVMASMGMAYFPSSGDFMIVSRMRPMAARLAGRRARRHHVDHFLGHVHVGHGDEAFRIRVGMRRLVEAAERFGVLDDGGDLDAHRLGAAERLAEGFHRLGGEDHVLAPVRLAVGPAGRLGVRDVGDRDLDAGALDVERRGAGVDGGAEWHGYRPSLMA